jgi:hypothetical protein
MVIIAREVTGLNDWQTQQHFLAFMLFIGIDLVCRLEIMPISLYFYILSLTNQLRTTCGEQNNPD